MSNLLNPFQLLELNIISSQDLASVTRSMHTYAVAWVHPNRKLSTRVDTSGLTNPTWNDKFVFRVDDDFLESDTSAIMIEIYAVHWFKDVKVGSVRVLIDNVVPILPNNHRFHHRYMGMEFVALQIRRPSGRPQGMLNIGVAVLDSSMRSMPLYSQLSSSAIGFKDLFDSPDHQQCKTNQNPNQKQLHKKLIQKAAGMPKLRRTKSDTSSMVSSNNSRVLKRKVSFHDKERLIVNGSEEVNSPRVVKKKGTSSKANSTVSSLKPVSQVGLKAKRLDDVVGGLTFRQKIKGSKKSTKKHVLSTREAPRKLQRDVCITDSELGPSPSEVAAEILAKGKNRLDDVESSVLGGAAWSVTNSVEGLQSKLERWRVELPPTLDSASEVPSNAPSINKDGRGECYHGRRRRNDRRRGGGDGEGEGLFSCFSNICGCECSITCKNPLKKCGGKNGRRRSRSPKSSTYV